METKKNLISVIAASALVLNLVIAGAVFAATTDTVTDQALVNAGALAVAYQGSAIEFMGSIDATPASAGFAIPFDFSDVEFQNTTGDGTTFFLSWSSENFQATTGTAAAGTGFNFNLDMTTTGDSDGLLAFDAGSVGTGNVAMSTTGLQFAFPGSGASGTTSGSLDLLTGSGAAAFNLIGDFAPELEVSYTAQLPGLYSGDVVFTINN